MKFLDLFTGGNKSSVLLMPFLIVGLGNPGSQYVDTRHNIGFWVADILAQEQNFSSFQKKFQSMYAEKTINQKRFYLLKPLTYMNLSGSSVGEIMRYYKIPLDHVLVIHDDLDLPVGEIRLKKGGGDGGHNGLKSITQHIGKDYWRLRIGIGHPGDRTKVTPYVLSAFSKQDKEEILFSIGKIEMAFPVWEKDSMAVFIEEVQKLSRK